MFSRSILLYFLLFPILTTNVQAISTSDSEHIDKAPPPPIPLEEMSQAQFDIFLSSMQKKYPNINTRINNISERFIGIPYAASPLGEGPGHLPDEDPLIRFDEVDCTTFIEEVMALTLSKSYSQACKTLEQIRYIHAKVGYKWRKHFPEAQWIPDNQKMGFIRDITIQIAPQKAIWVYKRLDPQTWKSRRHPEKWPKLDDKDIPSGTFALPVIPIADVLLVTKKIPSGTIVNIIREDIKSYPTRVTHQGLLIKKAGRTYFRHAGRAGYARVVDEPIEHFVKRNMAYRKWVVKGFNLQEVIAPIRRNKSTTGFFHSTGLASDSQYPFIPAGRFRTASSYVVYIMYNLAERGMLLLYDNLAPILSP